MKIYLAGYSSIPEVTKITDSVLESYLTYNKNSNKLKEEAMKYKIKDLFLDSGAYSSFTKKVVINIDEYINFCKEVKDYVNVIANLDVIGNPDETYKNWVYMKSKGVDVLPVIHYGADEKYFKIYFEDHSCKYLALGGLVPYARKRKKLLQWLDYSFSLIKKYFPVKIHLFGITSSWVLKRYPAFSCDSTSWLLSPAYGSSLEYKNMNLEERDYHLFYKNRKGNIKNLELAREYVKLQNEITKLWEYRGIKFN